MARRVPRPVDCMYCQCSPHESHAARFRRESGKMELSRRVVSVERSGQLVVCAVLSRGGEKVVEAETSFAPLEAGRSHDMLDVGSCKLRVTVAWSPILKGYPLRGFSLPSTKAVAS